MHVHVEVSGDGWMGGGDAASSGSTKVNLWGLSEPRDSAISMFGGPDSPNNEGLVLQSGIF